MYSLAAVPLHIALPLTAVTCTQKPSHAGFLSAPFHPIIFSQMLFFVRNNTGTQAHTLAGYLECQL